MRFLVDCPVSPSVSRWLEADGHDAVHAASVGLAQSADADLIACAMDEDRVVVTADLDYPRLLSLANISGPSIVLFRGSDWGENEIIARLSGLLDNLTEPDFAQSIIVVDRERVHRRRLPALS